ncbi:hypothetical protein CEXT_649971 [Caerostris extrusa]|uniref:Uncharacterized protein n=1 Tax=Caerostris extrusa TaxID=172846 RepID=A0AAV4TQK1_CAEEX|nr:hypothetical protein CEXT_649971 [Caerostris extrusa]
MPGSIFIKSSEPKVGVGGDLWRMFYFCVTICVLLWVVMPSERQTPRVYMLSEVVCFYYERRDKGWKTNWQKPDLAAFT